MERNAAKVPTKSDLSSPVSAMGRAWLDETLAAGAGRRPPRQGQAGSPRGVHRRRPCGGQKRELSLERLAEGRPPRSETWPTTPTNWTRDSWRNETSSSSRRIIQREKTRRGMAAHCDATSAAGRLSVSSRGCRTSADFSIVTSTRLRTSLALSISVALSFCFAGRSERLSETLEERAAEGARGARRIRAACGPKPSQSVSESKHVVGSDLR